MEVEPGAGPLLTGTEPDRPLLTGRVEVSRCLMVSGDARCRASVLPGRPWCAEHDPLFTDPAHVPLTRRDAYLRALDSSPAVEAYRDFQADPMKLRGLDGEVALAKAMLTRVVGLYSSAERAARAAGREVPGAAIQAVLGTVSEVIVIVERVERARQELQHHPSVEQVRAFIDGIKVGLAQHLREAGHGDVISLVEATIESLPWPAELLVETGPVNGDKKNYNPAPGQGGPVSPGLGGPVEVSFKLIDRGPDGPRLSSEAIPAKEPVREPPTKVNLTELEAKVVDLTRQLAEVKAGANGAGQNGGAA